MQQAAPNLDQVGLNLARDAQHRGITGIGGGEGGGGIEQAGAGDDQAGADLARRSGVAVRHVGGALLVPGLEDADSVPLGVQGIKGAIELDAGQAKDRVDPLPDQRSDQSLAAGERLRLRRLGLGGCRPLPCLHHASHPPCNVFGQ